MICRPRQLTALEHRALMRPPLEAAMVTASVTSKGQVTIPAEVRASLGLSAGERLEISPLGEGQYAIMACTHSL